jgi:hypothetical protein
LVIKGGDEMKYDNKRPINITLSPDIHEKLEQMERNARKLYGKQVSRSAIIEELLRTAGDRKSQVISRIKLIQKELLDLSDELQILEMKQSEEVKI